MKISEWEKIGVGIATLSYKHIEFSNWSDKLYFLVKKIHSRRDRNRARHLVRVLHNAAKARPELIDELGASEDPRIRGISKTLEYLMLPSEEKKNYTFDTYGAGWGLYETISHGVHGTSKPHNSDCVLWFAKIGGDAILEGVGAGGGAEFRDNSQAKGYDAGCYADFYDSSQASGHEAGISATFHDNSQASGYKSGGSAKFYDSSKATGNLSGRVAEFHDNSEAAGYKSGMHAKFYDNSYASGEESAESARFFGKIKSRISKIPKKKE